MSRWAKSEEELKWRVVICMCCHKMARLRPFPLNADASGRAHRLNWWCTTSWMRGNKSTSRLLVSLLLAPGNWTVQLKTARSYPESQPLSQNSGEPETSLFLLSAEVIAGLLMIDWKPAAALKADWNIWGDDCESGKPVLWTFWSYLYCCCWQAVET